MGDESLKVTSVRITMIGQEHLRATAQVVISDQFVVRGIKVLDGDYGLFVAYPNDGAGDEFVTLFNPLTRSLREDIETRVLDKYQEVLCGAGESKAG